MRISANRRDVATIPQSFDNHSRVIKLNIIRVQHQKALKVGLRQD